ncbi:MAG: 1-(5-phosphoribosyl)-5-[(5-phosphoribosylamino)methylideneamino]imidazole-4-carboxamide isomerase [Chloroflexota bacterium]|nr:MAG: 1-(5-phosphoribosyl)-5-[(5-phosphoribosylamino)methylideneamino]imidazole-4-carboxamide isomerase [Chloroflexota bacterium]
MSFDVIPAIDIKEGKCVRLFQGDFAQATIYDDDPAAVAERWESLGARRLHLIDLDGAAAGHPCSQDVIGRIVTKTRLPVQVGGGVRDAEAFASYMEIGVDRVMLGTVAMQKPDLVADACRRFGQHVVVAVDSLDGCVATHGWLEKSSMPTLEFVRQMIALGVGRFLYTDVSRDGTLTEPNYQTIAELVEGVGKPIIAAGGIASVEHLRRLREIGVESAVVGKALYTGHIDLRQALELNT